MKKLNMVELNEFTLYPTVSAPMLVTSQNNQDILRNSDEVVVTKSGSDYGVVAKVVQYYDLGITGMKAELQGLVPVKITSRTADECEFIEIDRTITMSSDSEADLNKVIVGAISSITTTNYEVQAIKSTLCLCA